MHFLLAHYTLMEIFNVWTKQIGFLFAKDAFAELHAWCWIQIVFTHYGQQIFLQWLVHIDTNGLRTELGD